jgi:hypothetical protein
LIISNGSLQCILNSDRREVSLLASLTAASRLRTTFSFLRRYSYGHGENVDCFSRMLSNCKGTSSGIKERGRYNKKVQKDKAYRKLLLLIMTDDLAAQLASEIQASLDAS